MKITENVECSALHIHTLTTSTAKAEKLIKVTEQDKDNSYSARLADDPPASQQEKPRQQEKIVLIYHHNLCRKISFFLVFYPFNSSISQFICVCVCFPP